MTKPGSILRSSGRFFSALIIIAFAFGIDAGAAGTTWFVSAGGNDSNSCSQAQSAAKPKRTIIAGLACIGVAGSEAGAGKTLKVAPGRYSESLVDKIPSGAGSGAQFTLQCETDRGCINLLPAAGAPAHVGFNRASHWITIRGFVFDGGLGTYLSGSAMNTHHDITWLNNEFRNATAGMGIQGTGSSNINIIGNSFHDIGFECLPGMCHGIYPSDQTTNWVIAQNEIFNISSYGIHLYADSIQPSGFTIERNLLYKNGTKVNGAGMIIYGANHVIVNNVAHSNVYEGILLRSVSNPLIYNNTTYNNGAGGISKESGVGAVCKNNLSIGNGGPGISGCDSVAGNIDTGAASSFFSPSGSNLTLIAGSPAIGAGVNLAPAVASDFAGNPRPTACCYDVGAYQTVTAVSPVPAGSTKPSVKP